VVQLSAKGSGSALTVYAGVSSASIRKKTTAVRYWQIIVTKPNYQTFKSSLFSATNQTISVLLTALISDDRREIVLAEADTTFDQYANSLPTAEAAINMVHFLRTLPEIEAADTSDTYNV
jgi:hypothetical protein